MDRRTALIAPIFGAFLLSACNKDEPDIAENEQSASERSAQERLAQDELKRHEATREAGRQPPSRQSRPDITPHVDF